MAYPPPPSYTASFQASFPASNPANTPYPAPSNPSLIYPAPPAHHRSRHAANGTCQTRAGPSGFAPRPPPSPAASVRGSPGVLAGGMGRVRLSTNPTCTPKFNGEHSYINLFIFLDIIRQIGKLTASTTVSPYT